MANFCHECAERVAPTMRACPNCGTTLVGVAPRPATTTTTPPPRADAGGYTPNLSGLHAVPRIAQPSGPGAPHGSSYGPSYGSSSAAPGAARSSSIPGLPRVDLEASPPASTSPYARAEVGPRLIAALVDFLIPVLALVPGATLAAAGYAANEDEGMMVMGGLLFLLGVCFAIWYGLTKDGLGTGQSFGKRHAGLMVVHLPSNMPCTRAQSAIRALVALVLNVVPAIGWLIEPVMVFIGEDGRRLGDRAAETQVIMAADYPAEKAAA